MNIEYPYFIQPNEDFLMRLDAMTWFQTHPRRTRNTFIMYCQSGEATVQRNLQSYVLRADMAWTLLPDSVFQILHPSPDFCVSYCVCPPALFDEVTMRMPSAFMDFLAQEPPFLLSAPDSLQSTRLHFSMMQLIYNDSANLYRHQIIVNTLQNYLLGIYDKDHERVNAVKSIYHNSADKLVKDFWALLLANYREQHEVRWYADRLCVSSRHLAQTFHDLSDTTPKQAIDDYLTLEIKIQLRSTHDTVQQIAERLHFSDQSVMGRFFKHQTGISPVAYRKLTD